MESGKATSISIPSDFTVGDLVGELVTGESVTGLAVVGAADVGVRVGARDGAFVVGAFVTKGQTGMKNVSGGHQVASPGYTQLLVLRCQ